MTTTRTVSAGDWLRMSAVKYPERDCLVTADRRFRFREVNARVNRLANALTHRGVVKGDRIALFATDSHRYIETLQASLKLGTTYVPLNSRLSEPELRVLLRAGEPVCLFISSRYAPIVDAVRDDVPSLCFVVVFDDDGTADVGYEELLESGEDVEPDTVVVDDDIVGLAFTSGTTGLPKGVMHSQRSTKHMVLHTILERRLPAVSFHYSPAPIFHVAGMLYPFASIARGATSLVLTEFDAATVLQWMQSGELNGCFLVPTMISSILQHPALDAGSYDSIESIAYGGAPMSPTLLRQAMAVFDCDFINMFGAGTEAGLQTLLTPEDHRRALAGDEHLLGSIGKPAFGVDLRVVDDEMNDVAVGEIGEIVTRADAVMVGYLGQPERTAEVLVDGWFRGGDMAYQDAEGYLYLSGRKNDMIIRGGENVYPVEIETVLAELPDVVEVAAIGVPDPHWGEVVCAYVVVRDGATFDEAGAREFCRSRLAAYKVPAEFRVETALPRNAAGKILKRELRHRVAAG